ncbi:MAG: hypothetical protein HOV80_11885 [Polyangiaceae bacterium]|nr:hypothetical protein [Polyangiaceae bacterium]
MGRERFASVRAVVLSIALSGCSEVLVLTGEGGGGGADAFSVGSSGATGTSATATATATTATASVGPGGGPSTIELVLEARDGWGEAVDEFDASIVTVYLNDAQGALKQSFSGAMLPLMLEVEDGDLVSYRWDTDDNHYLQSYRVTPDVYRITQRLSWYEDEREWCNVPSMFVTVTYPDQNGASVALSLTDTWYPVPDETPGEVTLAVNACDGDFDLFAYTFEGDSVLRYEVVEGVPFVSGGTMTIPLSLVSTVEPVLSVEAAPLDDAVDFNAYASWHGDAGTVSVGQAFLPPQPPPGPSVLFSPSLPAPASGYGRTGATIVVGYPADDAGLCGHSSFRRQGGTDELLLFNPKRLARPREGNGGTWEIAEPGEVGDVISVGRSYGGFEEWGWSVHEDAESLASGGAFPALPQGIDWTSLALSDMAVGHRDERELDGYAAAIADGWDDDDRTVESRYTGDCP